MDPPQLHAPPPPQQPPLPPSQPPYPDSPHSHTTDTLPDTTTVTTTVTTATTTATKLRLMCSFNGHIVPRPNTKSLTYAGGETRIIGISRTTTLLSDVKARLTKHLSISKPFVVKYQLPNEDLDSLISVSTDEDLENMIDEYDRLMVSGKLGRIRLFLFPVGGIDGSKSDVVVSRGDDWFFNSLNGGGGGGAGVELERRFSDPVPVKCLIGFDDRDFGVNPNLGNVGNGVKVGEKTVIETNSSFGSTSSSPSMRNLNLQQVTVQVEGGGSVEEQFGQMSVGVGGGGGQGGGEKQGVDEGFLVTSSPFSTEAVTGVARVASAGEIVSRVNSDDERSENGVGYWKQQEVQGQGQGQGQGQSGAVNVQQQMMGLNGGGGVSLQVPQQKQQLGSGELPSPESVSSDGSLSSALSRQKPSAYQDPSGQMPNGSNRFPPSIQVQHVENRHQPQQQLHILQEQPQTLQPQSLQHQQQQQQPQPQAQQQYIPAAAHYVHHPPPGAVPMPAYYPMYPPPPQQQHNHPYQYAVYYVPVGQAQGYNFPGQQQQPPNMGDLPISIPSNHTQAPPNPTIITTPAYNPTQNINMQTSNSEMGPGVYRTTNGPGGPPVAQQSQPQQPNHQYVGFPNTAPASGYAYELADPSHPQIYYTQPVAPALTSQYQGMTSGGPTMVVSDGSSQVSSDSVKQQT